MSLYVLCVSKKRKSVHTEFNHAKILKKFFNQITSLSENLFSAPEPEVLKRFLKNDLER